MRYYICKNTDGELYQVPEKYMKSNTVMFKAKCYKVVKVFFSINDADNYMEKTPRGKYTLRRKV